MAVSYTKTTYVNGTAPALNATNLNNTENGVEAVANEVNTHTHGSITRDGKVGTAANLPLFTGTAGAVGTKSVADAKSALGIPTFSLSGTTLTITL